MLLHVYYNYSLVLYSNNEINILYFSMKIKLRSTLV